jgi:2,3-bisphosphoglycerate-independent phosphoglycerate mutase
MRVLFIFLDGVGLGTDDQSINPFVSAKTPNLDNLFGGRKLLAESAPFESNLASLLALDAGLGVAGLPQSATGQAALLTGLNVPALVGEHYGPKPNPRIAEIIKADNIFKRITGTGKSAALLNAYPSRYFHGLESGKRLLSAIPLAVKSAGLPLFTQEDFFRHDAMSADFTGEGWRTMLGYTDAPVLSPHSAGQMLARLACNCDFSMFEYWASDYAGHGQEMSKAVELIETFDQVMGGLLELWPMKDGLILITSDHGNLEDLSTRRHTTARVPGIVIGNDRSLFNEGLIDLTCVAPRIEEAVTRT